MHATARTGLVLLAVALPLSACTGDPAPAATSTTVVTATSPAAPTADPADTSAAGAESTTARAEAATPTSTVPGTTTADPAQTSGTEMPPSTDQVPAGPTSAEPTPSTTVTTTRAGGSRPAVRGGAGGILTVGGREIARDPAATKSFLSTMGEPDETRELASCNGQPPAATNLRWGALTVTVPAAQPGGDYGFAYPAGAVSGWTIDPARGSAARLSGPEGVTVGTSLATLQRTFTTKNWDSAEVSERGGVRSFTIFAGDTTGADFVLDERDTVASMSAGMTCG